jgi:hypothetical protein
VGGGRPGGLFSRLEAFARVFLSLTKKCIEDAKIIIFSVKNSLFDRNSEEIASARTLFYQ